MSYLKTAGILLTVASGVLINLSFVKQIKNKTEALRQVYLLIDYIEISVKYQNTNIRDIFRSAFLTDKFPLLFFLDEFIADGGLMDFEEYPFNSPRVRAVFSDYACELMRGFFSMLGKSDVEGQILNCKTYKNFFEKEIKHTADTEENKIKTVSSLIFAVTFLIIIILF